MAKILLVLSVAALALVSARPQSGREYLPPSQGGYSNGGGNGDLSTQYGAPDAAPSSQYGAPETFGRLGASNGFGDSNGFGAAPSAQYGAPATGGRLGAGNRFSAAAGGYSDRQTSRPSGQYNAPGSAGRFGASNGFGAAAPSSQYGAPSSGRLGASNGFGASNGRLGASNGFGASNGRLGGAAPSSQYGAPSSGRLGASNGFGASNGRLGGAAPSSQYGAPSSGRLGASNGFGASNGRLSGAAPSSQYGAPSSGRIGATNGFGAAAPSSQYGAPSSGRLGASNGFGASNGRLGGAPSSSYADAGAIAAARLNGAPAPVYGVPNGGYNDERARLAAEEDDLSEPANYEFSYVVQDEESGTDFGHQESRQDEQAVGEYRVVLPDGRTQVVQYEANEEGYNPTINYEETPEGAALAQRAEAIRSAASQEGYSYGRGQGGPY